MNKSILVTVIIAVLIVGGACVGISLSGILDLPTVPDNGNDPVEPTMPPVEPTPEQTPDGSTMTGWSSTTWSSDPESEIHPDITPVCENHVWGEYVCDAEAGTHTRICGVCNTQDTGACTPGEYESDDSGETHSQKCTVCGFTLLTVVHTWGEWLEDAGKHNRTCSDCLKIEQEEHTFDSSTQWNYDDDAHGYTCNKCSAAVTEAHVFTEKEITKQPSCTEEGTKVFACMCGKEKTEPIDTMPHTFDKYVHDDSTSGESAQHKILCSVCDAENPGVTVVCSFGAFTYDGGDLHTHSKACTFCGYTYRLACNFDDYKHTELDGLEVHSKTCQTCRHVHKAAALYDMNTPVYDDSANTVTYTCVCGGTLTLPKDSQGTSAAAIDHGTGQVNIVYTSLQEAVTMADADDVIVLLSGMDGTPLTIPLGKKVIINTNGQKTLLHYESVDDIQIMAGDEGSDCLGEGSVVTIPRVTDGGSQTRSAVSPMTVSFGSMADEETLLVVGTATDEAGKYMEVYSGQGLRLMAEAVNSGKNTYLEWTIVLQRDADLQGYEFTPIGMSSNYFRGTFDGNNKVVSNLKITSGDYAALFSVLGDSAKVQDLTIENVELTSGSHVGALAGYVYNNEISNCHVKGDVIIIGTTSVDSTNLNEVNDYDGSNNNGNPEYGLGVGGLIGNFRAGTIKDCTVSGNINIEGDCFVGGLIGVSRSTVEGGSVCGNSGSVIYATSDFAGGLLGVMGDGMTATYDSSVSGVKVVTDGKYAGGITGRMKVNELVSGCSVSDLTVIANGLSVIDSERLPSVGYIVGANNGGNPLKYDETTGIFTLQGPTCVINSIIGENVVAQYRIGGSGEYTIVNQISGNYLSQYAPELGDTVDVDWQYTKQTVISWLGYTDAVIDDSYKAISGTYSRLGCSVGDNIDTSVVANGSTATYDETTGLYTVTKNA